MWTPWMDERRTLQALDKGGVQVDSKQVLEPANSAHGEFSLSSPTMMPRDLANSMTIG